MLKDTSGGVEGENRYRHLDYSFAYSEYLINKLKDNGRILLASPNELLPNGKTLYEAFYTLSEDGVNYDDTEFILFCESVLNDPTRELEHISNLNSSSTRPGEMAYTYAYELFSAFCSQAFSVGRIYTFNVNNVNNHSSFLDPITMSNLCVAPETLVLTKDGYEVISTLENEQVEVWNGEEWSETTVVKTGINKELIEVVVVSFKYPNNNQNLNPIESCKSIRVTPYHKWYNEDGVELRTFELCPYIIKNCPYKHEEDYDNEHTTQLLEWVDPEDGLIVYSYVKELIPTDNADTYCLNELKRHKVVFNGILTGQCQEITEPTSPVGLSYNSKENTYSPYPESEAAFCQLGALVLGNITKEDLKRICYWTLRVQESVFNISEYSRISFSHKQKARRSIGIGVVNLHHMLVKEVFSIYPEKEWVEQVARCTHEWMEAIKYNLLDASIELAKVLGTPELYNRSTYSKGVLPIDSWKNNDLTSFDLKYDWEALRTKGLKYGYRFSTHDACMPSESSVTKFGKINGLEPPRGVVVSKGNKKLSIACVVPEVERYAESYFYTWDKRSININDIVLSVVTNVQKFQDQSISLNWYYDVSGGTKIPESEAINRLFILPTKYGLKTSYYLNFNRDSEEEEELDIKKSLTEEMSEEEKLFYSKLKEAEDEVCENCSI